MLNLIIFFEIYIFKSIKFCWRVPLTKKIRFIKQSFIIIVLAKKEKAKNLLNYDAVNKILNRNKILAPK
ncbi:hypothetical protein OA430_05905, partial [Candidatus Pelagibacter sp.]|nr:hypothetical protein [Candidatus Pelagibacter sp.]